jgi:hypothetical protein
MQTNKPKGVKPKTRKRKLRSGVNWQVALKQKGVKQGLGIVVNITLLRQLSTFSN